MQGAQPKARLLAVDDEPELLDVARLSIELPLSDRPARGAEA